MAATADAARLTEAHRLAQARLGASVVRQMLTVWPILDTADLDGTFEDWVSAVLAVIRSNRVTSARLAGNYLRVFRALELGVDVPPVTPVLAEAPDVTAVTKSLLVTGPITIRRALGSGVLFDRAVKNAQATSAAAGMRHTLNGGRETVTDTVRADSRALGYARATSGSACAFCAMLASRGPVYKSEDTGGFQAHDHCACGVEPVYRRDAAWPDGARQYRDKWNEATSGLRGGDALNAFRRSLDDG